MKRKVLIVVLVFAFMFSAFLCVNAKFSVNAETSTAIGDLGGTYTTVYDGTAPISKRFMSTKKIDTTDYDDDEIVLNASYSVFVHTDQGGYIMPESDLSVGFAFGLQNRDSALSESGVTAVLQDFLTYDGVKIGKSNGSEFVKEDFSTGKYIVGWNASGCDQINFTLLGKKDGSLTVTTQTCASSGDDRYVKDPITKDYTGVKFDGYFGFYIEGTTASFQPPNTYCTIDFTNVSIDGAELNAREYDSFVFDSKLIIDETALLNGSSNVSTTENLVNEYSVEYNVKGNTTDAIGTQYLGGYKDSSYLRIDLYFSSSMTVTKYVDGIPTSLALKNSETGGAFELARSYELGGAWFIGQNYVFKYVVSEGKLEFVFGEENGTIKARAYVDLDQDTYKVCTDGKAVFVPYMPYDNSSFTINKIAINEVNADLSLDSMTLNDNVATNQYVTITNARAYKNAGDATIPYVKQEQKITRWVSSKPIVVDKDLSDSAVVFKTSFDYTLTTSNKRWIPAPAGLQFGFEFGMKKKSNHIESLGVKSIIPQLPTESFAYCVGDGTQAVIDATKPLGNSTMTYCEELGGVPSVHFDLTGKKNGELKIVCTIGSSSTTANLTGIDFDGYFGFFVESNNLNTLAGVEYGTVSFENVVLPSYVGGEHNYSEPVWTWDEYTSASAKFKCDCDEGHIEVKNASIEAVTVKPTTKQAGSITYTAKTVLGGKEYTDSKQEVLPIISTAKIDKVSVALEENLTLKIYAYLCDGYENSTMKFSMGEENYLVERQVSAKPYDLGEKLYVYEFNDIAPNRIGDEITCVLVNNNNQIDSKKYSLLEYCNAVLEQYSENAKLTTLVKDLLEYGAKAQIYTNYKTNSLVNDGIEGATTFEELSKSDMVMPASLDDTVKFTNANVFFGSVNQIIIKYTNTESKNVVAKIDGKVASATYEDGKYVIQTAGLNATDFATLVHFTLEVDGTEVQSLDFNVNSYVYAIQNQKVSEELSAMAKLARALYNYGVSAKNYQE